MKTPQASLKTALRWVYTRLLPALLGMLALLALWLIGQKLEPAAYDLMTRTVARPAADSKVVLVLIDDDSLDRLRTRFGPPPWPRTAHLEIFSRVNARHPALMVFDGHFVNVNARGDDAVFAEMRKFPNLVAGVVMDESARNRMNTSAPDFYKLNLGVFNVPEDSDGTIRTLQAIERVPLGTAGGHRGIFPALSLAAASQYLSLQEPDRHWTMDIRRNGLTPRLALAPEAQPGQGVSLPLSAHDGKAFYLRWPRLNAARPGEALSSHPGIPLWRFFEPAADIPDLTGKIAVIGASASMFRDYHSTPLSHRHLGPDIHAVAIDNILDGNAIFRLPVWLNLLVMLAVSALIMLIRLTMRGLGINLLYLLGLMLIGCSGALWLLANLGLWVDVVTPLFFMMIAFAAGSTWRVLSKEHQLDAMTRTLSQLVDPDVFREIQRRSHVLKTGGEKLEITSMFIDIRNFTAMAEQLAPADLTGMLNAFYSDVVAVVFRHQGTIDKFMGDGILVIFGAPLPNEAHRTSAVLAAQELLAVTARLSQRWLETRGIDTQIGITLNSGPAFVGFLGPADKLEYTAVGDTVNICVRLQELTKQFHTRLVVSEAVLEGPPDVQSAQGTREALQDTLSPQTWEPLGEVSVRGREATLQAFTLHEARLDV